MANDRRKLQHIHSSIADRQPTPQTLEVGEIAVNNAANKEFLSLKNTNNKVIRFSSDEQLISWMEKKEVMPYVGYVRGETGPSATSADTPTADAMGSYGITNNDLLNNNSEIIIKLNQVAAKNTNKYNRVNGAKDRYNKDINPTTDTGLTDGAGFFIDMSRYAMRGSNPSFSSITVTHQSNLSGTTNISDGAGGAVLNISTTTVNTTDTNWNEIIGTKISKITTLNESATTRTTNVGTEDLTVSGTTTEVHTGNVTITNSANVTGTTDGNEVELIKGYNYRDVNGNYSGTTGGTTTEVHTGDVTISNKANVTTTTDGNETKTIKGESTQNVSGDSTINVNGDFSLNVPNLSISADTFIKGNVCVTGTVTATGAIYSSDRNLKDNIKFVEREDINKVKNIFTKSFNFKGDDTKRKVYGVIAQEVQDAGLNELVHTKDDGTLAVDYTSLLILKTAYLEDFCAMLNGKIVELENEIKNLKENK